MSPLVFVAVILAAAPSAQSSPAEPVQIHFRASTASSTFWILDQVSEWSSHHTSSTYREAWEKLFPLEGAEKDLLRKYAEIRKRRSAEDETPPDPSDSMDGLLPPRLSRADAFAVAFLRTPDVHGAAAALELTAEEERIVQQAFELFRPKVEALLGRETHLERAKGRAAKWAEETKVAEFVSRMASFYGVRAEVAPVLTVDVLWAPEGFSSATCVGGYMLIPLSASIANDDKELQESLGVVVHEVGHYLASLLPAEARRSFANRVVAQGGLPNRRHPNILDEATQTALGNILFMRQELPTAFDPEGTFYSYESSNDWPDAIDSLARALAPIAERHLDTPGAFNGAFLDDALRAQRSLFPDRAEHHARVAVVYSENRRMSGFFGGLFPGVSRMVSSGEPEGFNKAASQNPSLPRWYLLTQASLKGGAVPAPTWARKLLARLDAKDAACAFSQRREPTGARDFVIVGRSVGDVRRALIALDRVPAVPNTPLCVPPEKVSSLRGTTASQRGE